MARLKELRRRIKGVQNIRQITRAMKMVAAARLRHSERAILALRPYASRLDRLCARFVLDAIGTEHPFFKKRPPRGYVLIGITSDRGLCGAYNNNVIRACAEIMRQRTGQRCILYAIGSRGIGALQRMGYEVRERYVDAFNPVDFSVSESIVSKFQDAFLSGDADEVLVVFSEFFSPARQRVRIRQLLPCNVEDFRRQVLSEYDREVPQGVSRLPREFKEPSRDVYIYEPHYEGICADLLHRNLSVQFHRTMLEAQASEQGARMVAMDNATRNADDMIQELTLQMNRQRQESITMEMLDVIGGSEQLR